MRLQTISYRNERGGIMVPALLKWIGNKQRFANTIVNYMPDTFGDYYEPFLGSGAVLAELLMRDSTSMYPHFNYAYGSDVLPFLIDIFKRGPLRSYRILRQGNCRIL